MDVVLLSSSDEKLERARQISISQLINYKKIPSWEKAVLDLTDGIGVDDLAHLEGCPRRLVHHSLGEG